MRKIAAILLLHLKEFFTSPGALVLMFIMPLLFSFIFGNIAVNAGKKKPVVNVVVSEDEVSSKVVDLLKKNDHFSWKKVTFTQAKKNVSSQRVVAAVIVPKNVEERIVEQKNVLDVLVMKKSQDYLALKPQLEGTVQLTISAYQAGEKLGNETFPKLLTAVASGDGVEVEQKLIQKESNAKAEITLLFVGFAVMFMMFGLSGAASTILDERISGTWGRLLTTPLTKFQISFSYLLAYFIMGWIQFAVLMIATFLMFDTGWGNMLYLIPFLSLVIACFVGFSLMIAGLVKTKQQAGAISAVLIVSTCMLGGVYWPLDFVPETMQKLAMAVPQSWAMSGFREIVSGSLHTMTLVKDTLALTGFSFIFFLIGLKRMKFE